MVTKYECNLKEHSGNLFKSQYTAGVVVFMASLTCGILGGWSTAVMPTLKSKNQAPFKMNDNEISWVVSISFFGLMFSAVPAGILADIYGTKITIYILSVLVPLPSMAMIYFGKDWSHLLISRFLAGFWIGMINTMAPLYLSEISQPNTRGFLNSMYTVMFRTGNIYALILALFIPYHQLPLYYSIPILPFLLVFPLIPETPYYYLKRDQKSLAKKSLIWLRNKENAQAIDYELDELDKSIRKHMETNKSDNIIDLLRYKGNRRSLMMVESLAILQKLAGLSSITSYLSITILKSMCIDTAILVVIIETVRMLSSLVSSFIIDKLGSRFLLLSSSLFCGVMMLCTGLYYYISSKSAITNSYYNFIPFLCISLHGIAFNLGSNSVCNNARSEMFSIKVKGKFSAITSTVTALVSFFISKMYLVIDRQYGSHVNFWIYAAGCFALTFVSARFFIETKGKTLLEIQEELNKTKKKDNMEMIQEIGENRK